MIVSRHRLSTNSFISQNLKKELKALKSAPGALATVSSSPPPAGMDVSEMTKEQLAQKLASYQQFMAKYIVDSQQQKVKAIAAAEMKMKQQYEEKLKLLSGSTTTTTTSAVTSPATPVVESIPAFDQRSAKVAAAAAAGKSRWGDMENQKVGASAPVAEVVVNGAVAPLIITAAVSESNVNFEKRNVMVAAAGKAGKSRWGEPEVARASQGSAALPGVKSTASSSSPGYVVPPEVEAADHGLRADGGVGGPSLAERVNFGAQLVNGQRTSTASMATASAPEALSKSASTTYFDKRNAMLVAAGIAGKSRWGEMEIQKAQSFVAGSLPSSSPSIEIVMTPEIEAADHGLRADGGVGGPSLAQRVNLGAALVSK